MDGLPVAPTCSLGRSPDMFLWTDSHQPRYVPSDAPPICSHGRRMDRRPGKDKRPSKDHSPTSSPTVVGPENPFIDDGVDSVFWSCVRYVLMDAPPICSHRRIALSPDMFPRTLSRHIPMDGQNLLLTCSPGRPDPDFDIFTWTLHQYVSITDSRQPRYVPMDVQPTCSLSLGYFFTISIFFSLTISENHPPTPSTCSPKLSPSSTCSLGRPKDIPPILTSILMPQPTLRQ